MTTEPADVPTNRTAWRWQLAGCCLVLVVLAFRQSPGRIVPDTKLDLTADPAGFLGRAMHLWEPAAAFGQLQNQAYGYLFPMGPFHLVGELAQLPAWVIQRAWWSLILIVAFLGMTRLAEELGIGRPSARLLGGLAFALTPRILVSLGAVSIEAWPTALAPWVLIPLVRAYNGGAVVRNAAASALAIVCMGGVNAAATAAAVLPALLWLLLAPGWTGRVRFAAWWIGSTAVATVWWWGPLLLLGRYSPPFLDWIETSANTTQHTSLIEVFRGSNHWLSYLEGADGAQWPAGWLLASEPVLILDTVVVAALGLAGLARLDMRARRVLVTGVVVGLVLTSAGYVGAAGSPLAESVRSLLDGPLAPLRNVHKFDVVLRLPLVLGLVHVVTVLTQGASSIRRYRLVATTVAAVVIAGVATPAIAGKVSQPGDYDSIPQYWHTAAEWLEDNGGSGRALLVPASPFAEYIWGSPRDEPLQALSGARWAVRDSVPLSSAGNIRLLDAVEKRLAAGEGGAGVVAALRRAGVGHLVVRNDLDRPSTGTPRPAVVHEALEDLPGVERVATFGPDIGVADTADVTVDSRLGVRYPAVEMYRVGDAGEERRVRAAAADGTVRMSGGPESLLTLGDAGLLDGRPVFVAGDGAGVEDPNPVPMVTDGLRRRAVWFGAIRDNATEVLRAGDDGPLDRAVRDFLPVDDPQRETVAVVDGIADVTASSSGSDPLATMARGPEHSPWAAVDGNRATSWISGDYGEAVGQWLEVHFDQPRSLETVDVALLEDSPVGAPVTRIDVRTDTGVVENELDSGADTHRLEVPSGETTELRLRVTAVGDGNPTGVGIRELSIPDVTVQRTLRAPSVLPDDLGGPASPATFAFATADGARPACVQTGEVSRCAGQLSRTGEEHGQLRRRADVAVGARYEAMATMRPRPGPELDEMLEPPEGAIRAGASSRAVDDPLGRPQAAVDLDPGTGWVAAPGDETPAVTLSWDEPENVEGVHIEVEPWLAASRPRVVEIETGDEERFTVEMDAQGRALLPDGVETAELTVRVLDVDEVVDTDVSFGLRSPLPAGASEIQVLGTDEELRALIDESRQVRTDCGDGPDLSIGSADVATELTATVGDLLRGGRLELRSCGDDDAFDVEPGTRDIVLESSSIARPEALTLRPRDRQNGTEPERVDVTVSRWESTRREVRLAERDADTVLTVTENANPGWVATLDGRELESVRVDGWAQGFVVPAGSPGTVELTYAPDGPYRAALGAGGMGTLAVAGLWWWGYRGPRRGSPSYDARHTPAAVQRRRGRHGSRRRGRRLAAVAGGVTLLGALGGVAGVAAAGAGVLVLAAGKRSSQVRRCVPFLAGACTSAAGVIVALDPWPAAAPGAHSGVAQTLVLVALAVVMVGSHVSDGGETKRVPPD